MNIDDVISKMIMSGSNVETYDSLTETVVGSVVGKILTCKKYENSDHLNIMSVDIGSDKVQILTGADNVEAGQIVPVAPVGSSLPGGIKMKKTNMRGADSHGMLLSLSELGFSDSVIPPSIKDGIWILPDEFEKNVGEDLVKVLELDEAVIDFEITPNRPDCLSMIGMAREFSATFDTDFNLPENKNLIDGFDVSNEISIEIKNKELCPRYTARIIKDVKIEPSPFWLQKLLMLSGVRPINNVVDITNFVMLETGNPIHAFDLKMIEGEKIIVDLAKDGEEFITLDGEKRKLDKDTLLIKDGKKNIGIAGIMGGLNSEIKNDTKDILIEVASFNADNIRKSSRFLGLRTEASSKYEKGVPAEMASYASDRVASLILELSVSNKISNLIDDYGKQFTPKKFKIDVNNINKLLGTELNNDEIIKILNKLQISVTQELEVTVPFFRLDINEEIDIVEEVARMYGYDNIKTTLPKDDIPSKDLENDKTLTKIKNALFACSVYEMLSYSFVSKEGIDNDDDSIVRIINPLGDETSVLRKDLLPNLLEGLSKNYSHKNENVILFEIGNTFAGDGSEIKDIKTQTAVSENLKMSIGGYGIDFFHLKGILTTALESVGIINLDFRANKTNKTYHLCRCADVYIKGNPYMNEEDIYIGTFGELNKNAIKKYKIKTRVIAGQILIEEVLKNAKLQKRYKRLPKFPAIERDLSFIVDEEIIAGDLLETINRIGKKLLEKNEIVDIFRGEQIGENKKSISLRQVYRGIDKTLTDEDVQKIESKIIQTLSKDFNAVIRDGVK